MGDRITKKDSPCPGCVEKSRLIGEQWRRHTSDIRFLIDDLKNKGFMRGADLSEHLEQILKRW